MTRIETAIAAAALALIAAGCNDPGQPRPATVVDRNNKSAKAPVRPVSPADNAPASDQKSEAYVIVGDNDTPKAVSPATKQGKVRAGRSSRQPAEPAKPKEPTFLVHGEFAVTKEKAKESAIQAAREKLHQYLMEQHPPVTQYPTLDEVRKMVIPHPHPEADRDFGKIEIQTLTLAGTEEKLYQSEIAVRVEPEHVRELRTRERSSEVLWVLAGLAALAAVVAVFFRIDAWTKGYLTSWLVLGTVGAGALLLGLWWWAK